MAVGQNPWDRFGVAAPPILVYFSGDWDVHWGIAGLLTHGHILVCLLIVHRTMMRVNQAPAAPAATSAGAALALKRINKVVAVEGLAAHKYVKYWLIYSTTNWYCTWSLHDQ